MKYELKFTPAAIQDLNNVYDSVLEVSKDTKTAEKYLKEFMELIQAKKTFPFSAPLVDFYDLVTDIRHISYKAYIAFYRVVDKTIEVLRILPAKSDYIKVLTDKKVITK